HVFIAVPNGKVRLSAYQVKILSCPSEPRTRVRVSNTGVPEHFPLNYAMNSGTWFIWNPVSQEVGNGMFHPESWFNFNAALDGTSNTLAMAEVNAYTPYYRNQRLAGA
ncbi:MAG: DUF1559 domain-containing protein, partial [Pirellulaceae bacterium]